MGSGRVGVSIGSAYLRGVVCLEVAHDERNSWMGVVRIWDVQYTLYSVYCTLYTVYTIYCSLYIVYSVHCTARVANGNVRDCLEWFCVVSTMCAIVKVAMAG